MQRDPDGYLRPYFEAVRRHGTAFASLLWASRESQAQRFDALTRIHDFTGQNVVDAGCGQADLVDYLVERGMTPASYTGIEAMGGHVAEARRKAQPRCTIVQGDFVKEPGLMGTGADVIVFCGLLNTLADSTFYAALSAAAGAARTVALNFLSSERLARTDWLTWHRPAEVAEFARNLGRGVRMLEDYLEGDCTMVME